MAYVTSAECTAEGIATDPTLLASRILQAQAILEHELGQWFEARAQSFSVDGTGTRSLFFEVPIIQIDSITEVNGGLVDPSYYSVFNRHLSGVYSPDDRSSPRVEKSEGYPYPGIYSGYDTWVNGILNYAIVGYWGYTDYDGHDDTVLAYDGQTGSFTVGQAVTGATSGATGTITADDDQGTEGTLTLSDVTGHFENNETITDPITGSAKANITTHWQGVTPLAVKMATILLIKRMTTTLGSPMYESVFRKGANDKSVELPYSLFADRELDGLIAGYRRLPIVRRV